MAGWPNAFGCVCCGAGGPSFAFCCGGISLPTTLNLTANAGSSSGYHSSTLTYGSLPLPGGVIHGTACNPGWWSPNLQTGVGNPYFYNICPCFALSTFFYNPTGGGTYTDNGYKSYGFVSRVCSPLLLSGNIQIVGLASDVAFQNANFTVSG